MGMGVHISFSSVCSYHRPLTHDTVVAAADDLLSFVRRALLVILAGSVWYADNRECERIEGDKSRQGFSRPYRRSRDVQSFSTPLALFSSPSFVPVSCKRSVFWRPFGCLRTLFDRNVEQRLSIWFEEGARANLNEFHGMVPRLRLRIPSVYS